MDCFEHEQTQVLLLEWIDEGERTEAFWKKFAEQLNALHNHTAPLFGLEEDNYMGSVRQGNKEHWMWASFFENERLRPMVERCVTKGLLSLTSLHSFDNVYNLLFPLFGDEPPSLLHGDLWAGNFLCNKAGEPVLIDPAVYRGHYSADLAMTTLFGGFRSPFYEAYNHHFPLPKNHEEQWAVCNLYPLFIHLYLFGTSYLPQIETTLKRFA